MIFDANAFLGKWPYWPTPRSTAAEVVEELKGLRIERAAVCSTRSIFVNWEDGNCETQAAATSFPEVLIPFACLGTQELSHSWKPSDYPFDRYVVRGFRGIRLYPQHHSYHLLFESFVDEILEDAAACRWPVVLPLRVVMNWGVPALDPAVITSHVLREGPHQKRAKPHSAFGPLRGVKGFADTLKHSRWHADSRVCDGESKDIACSLTVQPHRLTIDAGL